MKINLKKILLMFVILIFNIINSYSQGYDVGEIENTVFITLNESIKNL